MFPYVLYGATVCLLIVISVHVNVFIVVAASRYLSKNIIQQR